MTRTRIIVAISGASGSIYGLRLLERLHERADVESHLVMSRAGVRTANLELGLRPNVFAALAARTYPIDDIGAAIASGSYPIDSMVVAPCSINTMSSIAYGMSGNLITRAADVTLKERRRLVLLVRESPLHSGHLRAMTTLSDLGAIIAPPVPAFYLQPASVDAIVDHSVDRVLDLIGLPRSASVRWGDETATPLPVFDASSVVSGMAGHP